MPMYNHGSAFVASAFMLALVISQVNQSQIQAVSAAAAPTAATPNANKTDTKVIAEGGMGVDVAGAEGATSSHKEDKSSVKKFEAPPPEAKEIKTKEKENKNVISTEKPRPNPEPGQVPKANLPIDRVHIERSSLNDDLDIPGQAFFYVLVGITSTAIVLLVVRVYRLRLSRAERKYGVQGDRANQELTPLPMAIEDVNSDEEDHTVFEVNRQNIRIL